ncbi:MAG: PP0621 family protein [Herbaspirillum sp.]
MKYLIWLVIALAVVVWLQRVRKYRHAFARKQKKEQAETMLRCAQCGMYFPASESVTNHAGVVFCSAEHLRRASF